MIFTKKLVMTFLTAIGRKVSISMDDPRENLTEEEVINTMNLIVEKNIFAPHGSHFTSAVEAKVVSTDTKEYDLVL